MSLMFAGRLALAAALAVALTTLRAAPADAHHVCEETTTVGESGTVICIRTIEHEGESGGGGEPDHEARWNTYCRGAPLYVPEYEEGNRVVLITGRLIDPSEYDEINSYPPDFHPPLIVGEVYYETDVRCLLAGGGEIRFTTILPEGEVGVDPLVVRDELAATITPPEPKLGVNPPLGADRFGLVRIPTWFWIPGDPNPSIESSASLPGLEIVVIATRTTVAWDPGDGSAPVLCEDGGVEWQRGLADTATDCSHTYRRASAGEPGMAYDLTATATWEFTWTLNGIPQNAGAPFGAVEVSTEVQYPVGEIQAVGS